MKTRNVTLPKSPTPTAIVSEAAWKAIQTRDPKAEGTFFYAVLTTGVYCRPTCGARTPRRENVSFFPCPREAEQAGYRPCKRCNPNQAPPEVRNAELVERLCRFLETSEREPRLEELAEHIGRSSSFTHKLFRTSTGLNPKAYAAALRATRARDELVGASRVTEAVYAAGFQSSSRFYENASRTLGMTPSQYRNRGRGQDVRFAVSRCSLGTLLVACSPNGVCAISLGHDTVALEEELRLRFPQAARVDEHSVEAEHLHDVIALVDNPKSPCALPLDIQGTVFQQRVWKELLAIPPGETSTYSRIAQSIGSPAAARAVARACASNTLAVAIPCHRVVASSGKLSGYRWGIERKRKLLESERRDTTESSS